MNEEQKERKERMDRRYKELTTSTEQRYTVFSYKLLGKTHTVRIPIDKHNV